MLDTSSRANFKPTAEIDDLDALAKEVCRHLAASTNAAQNFLEHALAAGDALIRAKKQVKLGNWYGWLRSCDLSEDKAQRYMQLAAHRAELDPARVRGLSLRAALKLIGRPQPANSKPTKKKAATSFDALAWWSSASPEARSRFIHEVGLKPLLAAIPSSWQREAEQAVEPVSPSVNVQLRAALSATSAREAFLYLKNVKWALAAYPIHDVQICLKNQNASPLSGNAHDSHR